MPKKTVTQYAHILYTLTRDIATNDIDKAISVFREYLRSEHVSHLLSDIVTTLETHANEWGGNQTVAITTAREASKKELDAIVAMLGTDLSYTHAVDQTLMGGFTAQTQSLHIDASLKQTLAKLHTHLVS